MQIEIMFHDLNEPKQKELLQAYGVQRPEEMNWDAFPLTIIEVESLQSPSSEV